MFCIFSFGKIYVFVLIRGLVETQEKAKMLDERYGFHPQAEPGGQAETTTAGTQEGKL